MSPLSVRCMPALVRAHVCVKRACVHAVYMFMREATEITEGTA